MTPTRAELDAMMQVMLAAFDPIYGEAWNQQQLASALLVPGTHFAMIDAAGVIGPPSPNVAAAGFYLARNMFEEEELLLIAVDPQYRRMGLASRLMDHLFACARDRGTERIFLEMRENNDACHLYNCYGFEQVGFRKDYYRGADGILRSACTMSAAVR